MYSDAVTERVPIALRAMCLYYIFLALVGSFLMRNKKDHEVVLT